MKSSEHQYQWIMDNDDVLITVNECKAADKWLSDLAAILRYN